MIQWKWNTNPIFFSPSPWAEQEPIPHPTEQTMDKFFSIRPHPPRPPNPCHLYRHPTPGPVLKKLDPLTAPGRPQVPAKAEPPQGHSCGPPPEHVLGPAERQGGFWGACAGGGAGGGRPGPALPGRQGQRRGGARHGTARHVGARPGAAGPGAAGCAPAAAGRDRGAGASSRAPRPAGRPALSAAHRRAVPPSAPAGRPRRGKKPAASPSRSARPPPPAIEIQSTERLIGSGPRKYRFGLMCHKSVWSPLPGAPD